MVDFSLKLGWKLSYVSKKMNKTVNRNGKKLMMFSFSLKNEVKIGVIYP